MTRLATAPMMISYKRCIVGYLWPLWLYLASFLKHKQILVENHRKFSVTPLLFDALVGGEEEEDFA